MPFAQNGGVTSVVVIQKNVWQPNLGAFQNLGGFFSLVPFEASFFFKKTLASKPLTINHCYFEID